MNRGQRLDEIGGKLDAFHREIKDLELLFACALQQLERGIRATEAAYAAAAIKSVLLKRDSSTYRGVAIPRSDSVTRITWDQENQSWVIDRGTIGMTNLLICDHGNFELTQEMCSRRNVSIDELITIIEDIVNFLSQALLPGGESLNPNRQAKLNRLGTVLSGCES